MSLSQYKKWHIKREKREGWEVQSRLARPNLKGFILAWNTLDDVETEPEGREPRCHVCTAFPAPTLSAQHPAGSPQIGPEGIIPEFLLLIIAKS